MNMDEKELKELIQSIAKQVIRRMMESDKATTGALALVPSFVPEPELLGSYLKEKYADGLTCIGEGAIAFQGCKVISVETQQEKQLCMASLKSYTDITLVFPPLWLLKNIADGDDRGFLEQVFLKTLLWNKNVSVLLDFERPDFKRDTYFEGLSHALKAIENLGAQIVSLGSSAGKTEGRLSLVTEAEVMEAYKQGSAFITCAPGAIVTPLARDAAKELGVSIDKPSQFSKGSGII